MATLGNLNLGDLVYDPLSYYSESKQGGSDGQKRAGECLFFRVIGKNIDGSNTVTLVLESGVWIGPQFDYKEPTNLDSDRASKGNSNYKLSNVYQWLNSEAAGGNWYVSKHTYDAVDSNYSRYPGFKWHMSSALKNALKEFSKVSAIPNIDGGGTETLAAKVHLLSMQEIFGSNDAYSSSEGSQYTYYSNKGTDLGGVYGTTRSAVIAAGTVSGSQVYTGGYRGRNSLSPNTSAATSTSNTAMNAVIVLPSSTTVSTNKYGKFANSEDRNYYAMLTMPLIIEISGALSFTIDNAQRTLKYKVYDDSASISKFTIAVDKTDNVVYSTTNLEKGKEFSYSFDGSGWALEESHRYIFTATNSNGTTITETVTIKRVDKSPEIKAYSNGEWFSTLSLGNMTKPYTLKLKISDADKLGQDMFVYYMHEYISSSNQLYDFIGKYNEDQEIEYTIPDDLWKRLPDDSYSKYQYVYVLTEEYQQGKSSYYGGHVNIDVEKTTPAPYIDIESTSIGRKNVGFIVNYTPKIDTIQTITNLKIYLDSTDNELYSLDEPTPDEELSYEITKSMLYDMSIGEHTLIFVVTDDLEQSTTTNVTFTRYNDVPNIITESSLGDKNLGFASSFTVQDSEGDISSVNVYIDNSSGTPIKSETDVATGTQISYEITKEQLYGLSLGSHNVVVVANDDFGSTTTNISFNRTNEAPTITGKDALGNVNQPFREKITVSDAENDTTEVNFYIDSKTTPFHTVSDITGETEVSYSLTREMLDDLSLATHTIRIVATDNQGQTGTKNVTFTHFNESPSVTMAQDDIIHNGDFEVKYTVTDTDSDDVHVMFRVDGNIVVDSQVVTANEEHTQTIPMSRVRFGNHTLLIEASDKWTAMSPSTATLNFTYNSLPVITADEIGKVADGFIEVVSVSDTDKDNVDLSVYIDDVIEIAKMENVAHDTPINVTVSAITFGSLEYGSHLLNIYAKDSHDQTSAKSVSFEKHSKPTVTIDTKIPQEVTDAFSVTISYNNADGGEVSIKAFIDEQEITQ